MSGLLEINALCSGYKQSQVIHDLELKIQPKEIVAIMGRNGMGKTTLFNSLIGDIKNTKVKSSWMAKIWKNWILTRA